MHLSNVLDSVSMLPWALLTIGDEDFVDSVELETEYSNLRYD